MTRTTLNFWIDILSLLVMIALIVTGGLIYFVLPPGTGHTHFLFGLGRHEFGTIHFYLAIAVVILLALHVILHWNWICCVLVKAFGKTPPSRRAQKMWGISFAIGILFFLVMGMWWASINIEQKSIPGFHGRGHGMANRQDTGIIQSIPETQTSSMHVPALQSSKSDPGGFKNHYEDCPAGTAINGRITLSEASHLCRLSVAQMKDHLNLPFRVDSGERLGRLKRMYGLSIHEIRKLACR